MNNQIPLQQLQSPQKPCTWCLVVFIVFVIAVFIAVGILAYQSWQVSPEPVGEPVPVPKPASVTVSYAEIVFEDGVSRGMYPPVKRLIGIKSDGSKEVLLEDINSVLPISQYGQEQGRTKEEDDRYAIPFRYSFAQGQQKVYIGRVQDGTEIYDSVYDYNLLSGATKQLDIPSQYIFSYNHMRAFSPDGNQIASCTISGLQESGIEIGVFDLPSNAEILTLDDLTSRLAGTREEAESGACWKKLQEVLQQRADACVNQGTIPEERGPSVTKGCPIVPLKQQGALPPACRILENYPHKMDCYCWLAEGTDPALAELCRIDDAGEKILKVAQYTKDERVCEAGSGEFREQCKELIQAQEEADDWKTYTNERYGYQITYPNSVYTTENLSSGETLNPDPDRFTLLDIASAQESIKCRCGEVAAIIISAYPNVQKLSLEDYLKQNVHQLVGGPVNYSDLYLNEPTTFNGMPAIKFGTEREQYFLFAKDDMVFTITVGDQSVLTTFKFGPAETLTLTPDETSNWKTFSNRDYDFSFQYPKDAAVTFAPHVPSDAMTVPLPSDNLTKRDNLIEMEGQVGDILVFSVYNKPVKNLTRYVLDGIRDAQEFNARYVDEKGNPPVTQSYALEIINGVPAHHRRAEYLQNSWQSPTHLVYIQDTEHLFIFSYNEENASQADRILSTFQFLE